MTLFVPIYTWPGGDRNATRAVAAALRKIAPEHVAGGIEAVEPGTKNLIPLEKIQDELDKKYGGSSYAVFYSGSALIGHLRNLHAVKIGTSHLSPEHLLHRLDPGKRFSDVEQDLGLQMLNAPIYTAAELQDKRIAQYGDIVWTKTVPAFVPELPVLKDDDVQAPRLFCSLPAPWGDQAQETQSQIKLARLLEKVTVQGYEVILIVNPRTGDYLPQLQNYLQKNYPQIAERDGFLQVAIPRILADPRARVLMAGDSASVLAETIETLPPEQIIIAPILPPDTSERDMLRYCHEELGAISLMDAQGIHPPPKEKTVSPSAAEIVATEMLKRF